VDEFTPKTFAVGEILTAQDVNEHLVNTSHPRLLENVYDPIEGFVGSRGTSAIVINYFGQGSLVHLWLHINTPLQGGQNSVVGTLIPEITPPQTSEVLTGMIGNNGIVASINSSGGLAIRWTSSSSESATVIISGTYLMLSE